jgi:hypothetical protein
VSFLNATRYRHHRPPWFTPLTTVSSLASGSKVQVAAVSRS